MAVALRDKNGVDLINDAGTQGARVILYDSAGNPIVQAGNSVVSSGQKVVPVGGIAEGNWINNRVDRMGNVRPGNDLLWLRDPIEGIYLNTNIWSVSANITQAQSATLGVNFNSTSSLAANAYSIITSAKQFPVFLQTPLRARFKCRVIPQVNALVEIGLGAPTTTTAQLTNGAYWRWTSAGQLVPVLTFNGADVQGVDTSGLINSSNTYTYEITATDQAVVFSIYSASLLINQQTIVVPSAQPDTFSVTHLPAFIRLYITNSAPAVAPICYMSGAIVQSFDALTNKPWTHQLSGTGLGAEVSPTGYTQTAQWANSTAPGNATLSNTAAGYTTLGGLFSFAAVAGAATDYALFGFQVPAPYSFVLTGIRISTYNNGAAVATTGTLLQWGLYFNSPGVSLASLAPLTRVSLGTQSFLVGAAIGANVNDIDETFDAPLRTDSARYLGVILRIPVGTATTSQLLQGSILMKGYFE